MARTQVTGLQVLDGSIGRPDLITSVTGSAVITKLIAGSNVTLTSTGADAGTGDVTITGAAAPVSSVFGRIGAVIKATGDYNFTDLAGSLAATQAPAFTGDATSVAGATALTLATLTGLVAGTYNSITINVKGQVTAATNVAAGAVSSVFGRTGAVVKATGDYNFTDLAGSLTAAQAPALTGDITSAAGSLSTTLATVNASIGTFNSVTVNAKGLITAASNVANSGGTVGVTQAFTTAGAFSYTKPAGAVMITIIAQGAGGGGGAGQIGPSSRNGGAGGGGGGRSVLSFRASGLPATFTGSVGLGGSAPGANGSTSTNGLQGGQGGNTIVNSVIIAYGGYGGLGGGALFQVTNGGSGSLSTGGRGGASLGLSGMYGPAGAMPGGDSTISGPGGGGGGGGVQSGQSTGGGKGGGGGGNYADAFLGYASGGSDGGNTATASAAQLNGGASPTDANFNSGGGGGGAAFAGGANNPTNYAGYGGAGAYGAGGGGGGAGLDNAVYAGGGGAGGTGFVIFITTF